MQVGAFGETQKNIRDIIKSVVMDLSSDNLLKRCLHRQTQENSEGNINGATLETVYERKNYWPNNFRKWISLYNDML